MARRRRRLDLNLNLNLPFIEDLDEEEMVDNNEYEDLMEILDFSRTRNIDFDFTADQSVRIIYGRDRRRSNLINNREEQEEEDGNFRYDLHNPRPDSPVLDLFPRNPGVLGRNQERGLDSLQLGLGLQSWFDSSSASARASGGGEHVDSSSSMMMMNEVEVEHQLGSWFDQGMGEIQVTEMGHGDQGDLDWNIECAEALAMIIDTNGEERVGLHEEEEEGEGGGAFDAAVFNGETMSWDIDADFSHFFSMFAELHPDWDLEQLPDIESVVNHSVPTADHVIENLPSFTLTQDDVKKNNSVCSICTDEFVAEEKLKRLPCSHYYHGDCILPWLNIQNTCPVCRYKLPTK